VGIGCGAVEDMAVSEFSGRLPDPGFWAGKRVLLTGHTGFKGGWLALWLDQLGAHVTGMALPPEEGPSLYEIARIGETVDSRFCDIRDFEALDAVVREIRPQIVLHLAAQAYVRRSLADPAGTFATNVQGTVNLLESLRRTGSASVCLCVTSDKVYRNDETGRAFVENDPLGGKDPYSASKAACEIAVHSWRQSFAADGFSLATARGGNVVGGGDFGENRLVPDCIRAFQANAALVLRHPEATRPWQHVLDCLNGYLLFAEALAGDARDVPPALNIGPLGREALPVGEVAELIMEALATADRPSPGISIARDPLSIEARALALDTTDARQTLGWRDHLPGHDGLRSTAAWYGRWLAGEDMAAATRADIADFVRLAGAAQKRAQS
jgi:CDP-glucose 4,6-dehydratase